VRILWASPAPFLASGYGVQTAMITPRIQGSGHDVAIACNRGAESHVSVWPGPRGQIPIFPKGQRDNRHNMDKVERHAEEYGADLIMSHYDAWCLNQERLGGDAFQRPWVPWFPIDTDDVATLVLNAVRGLRGAAFRITQTHHGVAAMESHNVQCAYVPAAYDKQVYHPQAKAAARAELGLDENRFIAAVVAANSGTKDAPSRKSFPQVFQAWKWFIQKDPDALLHVHAMPQDHLNLDALAAEYEITQSVRFADPYYLYAGMINADTMALIYSAVDVLVNPSMGEGFGVPIVEAQACGTPVITGDWTAMSEVTRTGYKIPKTRAARYQMAGYGGDMFLPQSEAILDGLTEAVGWTHDPAEVSKKVAEYEVNHVYQTHWKPVLEEVESLLGKRPNRETRRAMRKQAVA
jgi:glycosyltransferase involved in cell wall biosynthesis